MLVSTVYVVLLNCRKSSNRFEKFICNVLYMAQLSISSLNGCQGRYAHAYGICTFYCISLEKKYGGIIQGTLSLCSSQSNYTSFVLINITNKLNHFLYKNPIFELKYKSENLDLLHWFIYTEVIHWPHSQTQKDHLLKK